jgi:hypothetical protein
MLACQAQINDLLAAHAPLPENVRQEPYEALLGLAWQQKSSFTAAGVFGLMCWQ